LDTEFLPAYLHIQKIKWLFW